MKTRAKILKIGKENLIGSHCRWNKPCWRPSILRPTSLRNALLKGLANIPSKPPPISRLEKATNRLLVTGASVQPPPPTLTALQSGGGGGGGASTCGSPVCIPRATTSMLTWVAMYLFRSCGRVLQTDGHNGVGTAKDSGIGLRQGMPMRAETVTEIHCTWRRVGAVTELAYSPSSTEVFGVGLVLR